MTQPSSSYAGGAQGAAVGRTGLAVHATLLAHAGRGRGTAANREQGALLGEWGGVLPAR